jgi:hypothetical protein
MTYVDPAHDSLDFHGWTHRPIEGLESAEVHGKCSTIPILNGSQESRHQNRTFHHQLRRANKYLEGWEHR